MRPLPGPDTAASAARAPSAPRPRGGVLILTASVGAGHLVAAERLAADLRDRDVAVTVVDALTVMGPAIAATVRSGSRYHSVGGNLAFDLSYWAGVRCRPGRAATRWLLGQFGAEGLLAALAASAPDVVVSTYPGATQALGHLRRVGLLDVPVAASVTDIAGLDLWVHPCVDEHLVGQPDACADVRRLVPGPCTAVRGLNHAAFETPPDRAAARRRLGWADGERVLLVSGGGWGVGDLEGAAGAGLDAGCDRVVVVCGRNDDARERIARGVGADPRVRTLGFTDAMPSLLAAADAVIHSTGGLTALEAVICGCPLISYGWGRGHLRVANRAFADKRLATVVLDRSALPRAIVAACETPRRADDRWRTLPRAADVVVERLLPAPVRVPVGA